MPLVKQNFRRWMGLAIVANPGNAAALPPSAAASFVCPTGAVYLSASFIFIWNGTNFNGFSAALSASGS